MKLLAFETATEACSVALWIDGEVIERHSLAPRRHAEFALPWAEELLNEAGIRRAQLDAIAVGRGPGAFTGVRLAVALSQGIALALDIPVLPISTLAVLAAGSRSLMTRTTQNIAVNDARILAAIDARMGEIYLGGFALAPDGDVTALGAELLAPPQQLIDWRGLLESGTPMPPSEQQRWLGTGTGFAASDAALVATLGPSLLHYDSSALPHASDLARLAVAAHVRGDAVGADQVEPAYLRNKVALTLLEQGKR
ncbi:MAG: tRNA (adenosine(37)-N6)-threonylcarbamoyltransferase complex dimerization subunit type 1 TsaB [Lysobacteraceae bacterium]